METGSAVTSCSEHGYEEVTPEDCLSAFSPVTGFDMYSVGNPKGCSIYFLGGYASWMFNHDEVGSPSEYYQKICSDGSGGFTNKGNYNNDCEETGELELSMEECFEFSGSSNGLFEGFPYGLPGCFRFMGNRYFYNELDSVEGDPSFIPFLTKFCWSPPSEMPSSTPTASPSEMPSSTPSSPTASPSEMPSSTPTMTGKTKKRKNKKSSKASKKGKQDSN